MTLDDARRQSPGAGFALYAYDAGGPVTFEVLIGGEQYHFTAPTAAEAIAKAFPPALQSAAEQPEPDNVDADLFG